MILIIALILSLCFLLFSIIKFDLHPFFALFLTAIIFGVTSGMDLSLIIQSINEGFGGLLGNVGPIIIFGVLIGILLEKSGGALVIAMKILKTVGEKSVHLAMMVSGYILSIPVFGDSVLLIMDPLNKVLSNKAKVSYAGTTAALATGLTASHVMVPPTPGPIAAAGILDANLGDVMLWGLVISILSLTTCYIFAKTIASRVKLKNDLMVKEVEGKKPTFTKSMMAVVVPILLITTKSISEFPTEPFGSNPQLLNIIGFLGTPAIALAIGVFIALTLPSKWDKKIISSAGWFGDAIKVAAPILLITGAGGIFGKTLQNSGMSELISSEFNFVGLQLMLPFLLAAFLKTSQGSSTVALITTASIVAPLMPVLGLDAGIMKTMTVLAIGAGSTVTSHVNDSFFWIMTQLTGMTVKQGYKVQSLGTATFGITAIILINLITWIVG